MWDRARTSATAGLDRLHRHLKDGADKHKLSTFYQNDAGGPANALGIETFEAITNITRPPRPPRSPPRPQRLDQIQIPPVVTVVGVASPAARCPGIFPTGDPADHAEPSSRVPFEPPPRNPRRLLRQYSKDSGWPSAAASYPEPQIITDSESSYTSDGDGYTSSPASDFKLASTYSRRRPPALDQISPPSSPETGAFKYDAPVSPIDDDDVDYHRDYPFRGGQQAQPFTAQRQMSNVPVPVHQYRAYEPPAEIQNPPFENPRSLEDVPVPHNAMPRSSKMRINLRGDPAAGQRFRFLTKSKAEPTETLSDRPMQAGPTVAPLNIPRRSSKRISRAPNGLRNISAPLPPIQQSSELETPPRPPQAMADRDLLPSTLPLRPLQATTPAPKTTLHNANNANALPTPPSHEHPSEYPPPPSMQPVRAQSPAGSELTPTGPRIIKRKPPQTHQVNPSAPSNLSSSSPAYVNPPPRRASAAAVTGFRQEPPKRTNTDQTWTQPPSRFSVTTYTTPTAGTPQQTPEEQMLTTTEPVAPIVSRPGPFAKRDIPNAPAASHTITIPKQRAYMSSPYGADNQAAVSSEVSLSGPAHGRADSNKESTRRSSIMSTTKPLPPAPPELASSDDRISQLNAILSGLAHRRVNINKSIQQMTELMPRDNLMASAEVLRKREIEKQKVEGLKQELAEIQHEEYDLGLKLHRAYKRRDKDAVYEPTTLWVRRITS
ncbi:large tegument ul36 [Trichoderma arundinaceum]|uniref:Large tegument ul36 n=1 Tax=Trichoderma arundinaceum TaxID=490622 RepID=A0A395NBI9_TRIAR|nr:large tegument ul36 [Trichoderma arundinaceum]